MSLVLLPSELLEHILIFCDPTDVAKASETCHQFHDLIYNTGDDTLWRGLYLAQGQILDDPRKCLALDGKPRPPINWRLELQRAVRANSLVVNHSPGRPGEIGTVLQTLLHLSSHVRPLSSSAFASSISKTLVSLPVQLRHGWIDLAEKQVLAAHERQLVARFHTYFGITQDDLRKETLVRSRAFIYNMQNYTWDNDFGPFNVDGTVNWLHIRAVHHVVSMQVLGSTEGEVLDPAKYEYAVYPMSLPFTQIALPQDPPASSKGYNDWVGIQGEWTVSFCFCDHRVLQVYNDGIGPGIPADTSVFEADDFQEVFRNMRVELHVLRTEPDPEYPDKPVIFFAGVMKDLNQSIMNGQVWMTSEGYVRWHFVSGEQNNAIWSSEGVQIGGLRSAYGVLGSWTTIFHDNDDPVGPFWLRKTAKAESTSA